MKYYISKSSIGSLISFIKPKSLNIKTSLILLCSLFLFNAIQAQTTSSHYGHLKLKISSNSLNYNTEFYFNSNASQGLDPGYDASVFGGNPPVFSIYSYLVQNNTGMAFAVQALSNTDMNNVTVSLGINAELGQEVTFSIEQSDVPESVSIYLEDRVNNTFTLLNTNDYNFTTDTNLSGTGRFYLIFEGDALNTTQQSLDSLNIHVDAHNNNIVVKGNLDSDTEFRLYDTNGRLVNYKVLEIGSTSQTIDTSALSTGVYIVKLISQNAEKRTQKIVIQ